MGKDAAQTDGASVSEGPSANPREWFNTAVGLAIFTGTASFVAVLYVFFADTPRQGVLRAQMIAPFGVALFALVTFCTVVWRGLISTQQLEQQAKQLEHQAKQLEHQAQQLEYQSNQLDQQRQQFQLQIKQNDADEDNNLAKMLQEGARLLGDKDKEAQVLGGIVTLEIVVESGKARFAVQAMNILADFYARSYHNGLLETARLSARRSLARGKKKEGVIADIAIELKAENRPVVWEGAAGISMQRYIGGFIQNRGLRNIGDSKVNYRNVTFDRCNITKRAFSWNCKYSRCVISEIVISPKSDDTRFSDCNFSNADFVFSDDSMFNKTIFENGNFYIKGSPPKHKSFNDWASIMDEVEKLPAWTEDFYLHQDSDLD